MILFFVLIALMVAATVVDGWSQHKMLTSNGGKGFEVSKIYGTQPTYARYYLINVPVLATVVAFLLYGRHIHTPYYWPFGVAFCAWHAYGVYLNQKNF